MNIEVNATLKCQLRCQNCNRCPKIFEKEDTDITPQQIDNFIEQIKGKGVDKIKLLGGEPTMSKHFNYVYSALKKAMDNKVFNHLKLDYNHILPLSKELDTTNVRIMGKSLKKKRHLPVLWSPKDLGYNTGPQPNCQALKRCGQSFDWQGFLPCSQAIALVRIFGWEHLYRKEVQLKPWGLEILCQHCIFSMPQEWTNEHLYLLNETPPNALMPTESFLNALNRK